ncbi:MULTISPECIES: hypothetical protein [Prochlorococcus]|uniref:hypothetical protein n=1 Tax=Prochlorococcus TaxID=1218 RepID=UPI000533BA87|nr:MULTISPECIES: hypothetical protein [Prochlorococcus]KGG12765.1 putative protein family PM-4 [Prochlorococcus sp. MIT 0601]
MIKDQLAFIISLAMHSCPEDNLNSFSEHLNTYQSLCHYFQELSIEDIEEIASSYGVSL